MKIRAVGAIFPLGFLALACGASSNASPAGDGGGGIAVTGGAGGGVTGGAGGVDTGGSGGVDTGGAPGSTGGATGGTTGGTGGATGGATGGTGGATGASDGGATGGTGGGPIEAGVNDAPNWSQPDVAACVGQSRFFYPTLSQRTAPAFPPDTTPVPATSVRVRVMNGCPITLWTQFNAPTGVVQLATGEVKTLDVPTPYSGRVTAFKGAAPGSPGNASAQIAFAEMNLSTKGNGALNFNFSYVDWVGLPAELAGIKADGTSCGFTACYIPYQNIVDGCPAQLVNNTRRSCDAPAHYCGAATGTAGQSPFCTQLDAAGAAAIATDAKCQTDLATWKAKDPVKNTDATVGTGSAIFGCTSFWGSSAYCCAKVNRGVQGTMVTTPKENNCGYYASQPYNPYAFWSQTRCPFVYAFPYDDANNQSGFQTCAGGRELDITWCPNN
jgi:hypothetical protein